MRLQTSATQVALRTATLLRAPKGNAPAPALEPIWYRVILSNPPTHQLLPRLRKLETRLEQDNQAEREIDGNGFYRTRNKKRFSSNAKHLYKLPTLRYEADRIRHLFYTNHPWELARPRNMIESGLGSPISALDWSTILQSRVQLSGESVVQRTLYIAKQPDYVKAHGSNWFHAYETARLEFYQLRMRELADRKVAEEEALMHGAVFGPSSWDSTIIREQQFIDKFVEDASEASKDLQAKRSKIMDDTPEEPAQPTKE